MQITPLLLHIISKVLQTILFFRLVKVRRVPRGINKVSFLGIEAEDVAVDDGVAAQHAKVVIGRMVMQLGRIVGFRVVSRDQGVSRVFAFIGRARVEQVAVEE